MKIGLFFGSFNPIHTGHLILANYMAEFTDLKEVWFVISPHNPFKQKATLLSDNHRLELVNLAITDDDKLKVSNIEFKLPQPSYTINTLVKLKEKYKKNDFVLIMGADNLESFNKWKNYEEILENHQLYVYPRPGHQGGVLKDHPNVVFHDAPVIEISSTFIREAIKHKKNVRYFMPDSVYKYITEMHFYEK